MAAIDRFKATPFQEGGSAFPRGLEECDNPYAVGSPEAAEWHKGWMGAKKAWEQAAVECGGLTK